MLQIYCRVEKDIAYIDLQPKRRPTASVLALFGVLFGVLPG